MPKVDYGDNIDQDQFYGFNEQPKKPNGHSSNKEFQLYSMHDLMNLPSPEWEFRNLLFKRQIAFMYGPSQSLKSFIALGLASMKVHGMEWLGRPLKPCNVVYVAGEGFALFGARRRAWFLHNGVPLENDGLTVVDRAVNLLDDHEVDLFLATVRHIEDVGLTILDTWSTCVSGQDENSSLMAKAIENVKRIGRTLNCAVLVVHHPGKDTTRGLRGHSSLTGNPDAIWEVEREPAAMMVKVTVTKQKDAENGKEFYFAAHKVPLGICDDEGVELDSLVVEPCDGVSLRMSTAFADRVAVAKLMQFHQTISTTKLARQLMPRLGIGLRRTIDRINDALPPNMWVRTRCGDHVVELFRHVAESKGTAAKIQMRKAETHIALAAE